MRGEGGLGDEVGVEGGVGMDVGFVYGEMEMGIGVGGKGEVVGVGLFGFRGY